MMKKLSVGFLSVAVLAAFSMALENANAEQLYSFESIVAPNGPDGFFGLGAAVAQSTIGVTDGEFSLEYRVGVGGFVGARTESVIPAALNNPPGVKSILFDMTILDAYPDTFADVGITIFGHQLNANPQTFGNQVQFPGTISIPGLGVGTHTDLEIVLDNAQGPFGIGKSFNEIFGPGEDQLTASSAFQFYINKNAATPVTVYIDNVRTVVPEPASVILFGFGAVMAGFAGRSRR